ncbi:MAG: CotH kinase family protein [Halobacteriales archaeon]|nr:CotH kinase family protein [Halobacteriales archaeon]
MFTVPPLLLLAYLLAGSIADYHESLQFDDSWSRGRHLDGFFMARAARAARLPRAASLALRLDPDVDDPGIVRLRVARDQWTEVEQNPLVGWGRWLDATLIVPGGSIPVELRKRGDTSLHWTTGKLSFTLQTPKSEHFHGYREAALSQKSVLIQYLTNSLPRRFGLLTPFTTVTPVFLNDRYYGIFRFVEEVDESFVRRNGRMPGNVFRADAAERSEYFKGLPRAVFRNPDIWDRVAEEDVQGVAPDSALRELIRAVNGTSLDDHLHLMSLVERNEIARLLGAMLVVGDPYHMSGVHNQFWYEDPSTGHLHPIPWDLRLLLLGSRPAPVNEFLRAALRDPYLPDLTLMAFKRQVDA